MSGYRCDFCGRAFFKTLSERPYNIFVFVRATIAERGYPPTYQEIADEFGYRSLGTVSEHVHRLADAGLLTVVHGSGITSVLGDARGVHTQEG